MLIIITHVCAHAQQGIIKVICVCKFAAVWVCVCVCVCVCFITVALTHDQAELS